MRHIAAFFIFCSAATLFAQSPIFNVLANFNGTNGYAAWAPLVEGAEGNFYGTTSMGGTYPFRCGTLFRVTPDGNLSLLHTFDCFNGIYDPRGALVLASDGDFYGTAFANEGGVYKVTADGVFSTIYAFAYPGGYSPYGALVQMTDGSFYGTTSTDWASSGTVFKLTPQGAITYLHTFNGQDGASPRAGLVLGADGNFYGTTFQGGDHGYGTVFKMTPEGILTSLHSFDYWTDGAGPAAELVKASDGNFYGTTSFGGSPGLNGTIFRLTPQGTLTTLHIFGTYEGAYPAGLVQAKDGNLYGTTQIGGPIGDGTIFQSTLAGELTILHQFTSTDGATPMAAMVLGSDGDLYGTTASGGTLNQGVIYRLGFYSLLSVNKSGEGTVSSGDQHIYCGNQCSYSYLNRTQVVLSAVPAPGYTFTGWTGCNNVNGSYCTVSIAGPKNIAANFIPAGITLTSLTFKPTYVRGGQLSAGTLTLNAPAPPGGGTVALSSDHPGVAHPPSFVFVPGGKSSVQFAVNTFPVKSITTVMITATAGSSHVSGTLTVGTAFLTPSLR